MLTLSLQWEEVNAPLLNLGAQELKDELWYQFFLPEETHPCSGLVGKGSVLAYTR